MNALFLFTSLLVGVDPTVDQPRPAPNDAPGAVPPGLLPIPLGNPAPTHWIRFGERVRMIEREPFWQTEDTANFFEQGLSHIAVGNNWYLGRNFSASVAAECGINGFGLPATVNWFLVAFICIEVGFDLVRFKPVIAVMFQP